MDDTLITTLEDYKESYNIRLENHLKEYVDYDELHFIKKELELYNSYYDSTNIKRFDIALGSNPKQPFRDFEYRTEKKNVETSNIQLLRMIFDFDKYEIKYDNLELADFYNIEMCEKLSVSFSKIIEFLTTLQNEKANISIMSDLPPEPTSKLNWAGTELELSELIKALIQANKLNPELTQTEIFKRFRYFFNVKDFDENDKLKDIRKRTNTLAIFINKLEISLSNWIKAKD